jgi:hypothetical protein
MQVLETPVSFSNLQKELLKLYAAGVSDEDLLQIRLLISNYFADKATKSMDDFLKEKNISTDEYNNWENEHNRRKSSY